MTPKFSESKVEDAALECFESLGYTTCHASKLERQSYSDIILTETLQTALETINPQIPTETIIDEGMDAIEKENDELNGVLPKDYGKPSLGERLLGELVDLISNIGLGDKESRSQDILGRVYEYFLGEFASAEGKKGGQFYTPRCVVELLVKMIEPYKGRVYDPCCGSGGMFVQSEKFVVEVHGGEIDDISIYGQESNPTTWKL